MIVTDVTTPSPPKDTLANCKGDQPPTAGDCASIVVTAAVGKQEIERRHGLREDWRVHRPAVYVDRRHSAQAEEAPGRDRCQHQVVLGQERVQLVLADAGVHRDLVFFPDPARCAGPDRVPDPYSTTYRRGTPWFAARRHGRRRRPAAAANAAVRTLGWSRPALLRPRRARTSIRRGWSA